MRQLFILFLFNLVPALVSWSFCSAAVPRYNYFDEFSKASPIDRELVVAFDMMKHEKPAYNYNKLIPENIATMDGQTAISAIADRGVSDWWMNSELKKSDVGQTVDKVEKVMRQEVSFQAGNSPIHHKVVFQYLAFQARAEIKYSGLADAQVYFPQKDSTVGIEMSEKLAQNQAVVLNHQVNNIENSSRVGFRITF